jgi:hypothetical protein
MLAGILFAGALLSMSPASSRGDTLEAPGAVGNEATSAPTDSSARRVRSFVGEPTMDPRLLPDISKLSVHDTLPRRRPRAIQYSDWYYRRLQIHRWGSWIELPLFATEYWLGDKLISRTEAPASWVKPTHETVAYSLGALFTVNTVTGLWNLWESRNSTDDRALVWTHSALMLAADGGFAVTGLLAGDAEHSNSSADQHRAAALTSIGLATAGTLLMWVKRGF